jgi:CelD/BcsL family acetyltransferase involved in cellulose biosynthesis
MQASSSAAWPAQAGVAARTVQFSRARAGFDGIAAEWAALAARTRQMRFFQHPDWYGAWFSAGLADPDDFVFVTCREAGQLAAVLPLHAGSRPMMGLPVRTLGFFEHPHATLAGALFGDGQEAAQWLPQVLQALHRQPGLSWDILRLDRVPERACALPPGTPGLHDTSAHGLSAYLDTRGEEAALGPVSKSFKRELRRRTRIAEETAPLQHQVHSDAATLEAALDRVLAIEASGWKGVAGEGTAIMLDPALRRFYHALAQAFGRRGECAIIVLKHGEADVAGQIGLLVNGTLNLLKIAYHEAHCAIAPGNLVMERTIRWCCAQPGVQELSMVTNPPWGHLWKPQHERVLTHRFFNPTARGRLLQLALRAKQWNDRRRAAHEPQAPAAAPEAAAAPEEAAEAPHGTPTLSTTASSSSRGGAAGPGSLLAN